jgi:hypothetical protein
MGSRARIDRLVPISGNHRDALKLQAGGNKSGELSGALGHKAIITNGIMPEAAVMQRAGHVRCTRETSQADPLAKTPKHFDAQKCTPYLIFSPRQRRFRLLSSDRPRHLESYRR